MPPYGGKDVQLRQHRPRNSHSGWTEEWGPVSRSDPAGDGQLGGLSDRRREPAYRDALAVRANGHQQGRPEAGVSPCEDLAIAIRRGVFQSVPDLITSIEAYLTANNTNPKPFIWTATAEQILTKVRRGRVALNTITN